MSGPAVAAAGGVTPAPAQEVRTFDQALEQRQQAQAAAGAIPAGLWHLGETTLRISGQMQFNLPRLTQSGFNTLPNGSGQAAANPNASGDDMFARAKYLIDSSFGYAVLTQQLVRGANQAASGLTTLMRSS